jgi:hypothetical protein
MTMSRILRYGIVLVLTLLLLACGPEASRQQGGGPGGDINNRPANSAEVQIHGPTDPAFNTPIQGQASQVSQQ